MTWFVIPAAAFAAALLTFYAGFGLGTLLMPVLALFFPLPIAIAATAVAHAASNVFKIILIGRHADRRLVLRFGLPALGAAIAGAWVLGHMANGSPLARYDLGGHTAVITPLKLALGGVMLLFAGLELSPRFSHLRFDRKYLVPGGILSGFLGGFSGHQGALRSAFLARLDTTPAVFVATNAVIGFLVDGARLGVYAYLFIFSSGNNGPGTTAIAPAGLAVLGALAGVAVGRRYLGKITMRVVRKITGALLGLVGIALTAGVL